MLKFTKICRRNSKEISANEYVYALVLNKIFRRKFKLLPPVHPFTHKFQRTIFKITEISYFPLKEGPVLVGRLNTSHASQLNGFCVEDVENQFNEKGSN